MLAPRLEWLPFLHPRDAARDYAAWATARPTYQRGDELRSPAFGGGRWKDDAHCQVLAPVATRGLYERAAGQLLRYRFYPPRFMESFGAFAQAQRRLREGDAILQRIHVVPGLVDAVTLVRVSERIDEPRRQGFAYVTTQCHFEIGEWWCWVELRPDQSLTLNLRSISRAGPRIAGWQRGFTRRFQLAAHRAGLAHFARLLG